MPRVKDEDPILKGKPLRAVSGADVSHVYYAGTTTAAPVYIASSGTTLATAPLTTSAEGYVVDANAARVWYEEGSYDRVVDGETHTTQAVSGLSPGGRVLGFAKITSSSSVTGSTPGDGTVPLYCNNVTLGIRPVVVVLSAGFMHVDTDQVRIAVFVQAKTSAASWVAVGSGQVIGAAAGTASGTGLASSQLGRMPCHREIYLAPTTDFTVSTSYDFRAQIAASTAGKVATLFADDVAGAGLFGPASLRVVEV